MTSNRRRPCKYGRSIHLRYPGMTGNIARARKMGFLRAISPPIPRLTSSSHAYFVPIHLAPKDCGLLGGWLASLSSTRSPYVCIILRSFSSPKTQSLEASRANQERQSRAKLIAKSCVEAPWNKEGKNEHFHVGGKVGNVHPAINTVKTRILLFES